jgi:hypothetical protein
MEAPSLANRREQAGLDLLHEPDFVYTPAATRQTGKRKRGDIRFRFR